MSQDPRVARELRELDCIAPSGYFVGLHIRLSTPVFSFHTIPSAWMERYKSQAYAMRDPTVAWGFSTLGHVRWSDIEGSDSYGVFDDARSYGLRFGVTFSHGILSSRSIANLVRCDREFSDAEIAEAQAIFERLHRITEPNGSLTKAQAEALRLIAEGERHTAAAAKLNISESALKARLTGARERLVARTTAEAVQRAKEFRLL